MITEQEILIARHCITTAVSKGAASARVSMSKSMMDGYTFLNGDLDKVTHSADRSLYIHLFVDGRYGTFSTNRFEYQEIEDFISKAIIMVRMLGEDLCRCLPDPERQEKNAKSGLELDLYDQTYLSSTTESRLAKAKAMSLFGKIQKNDKYRLISEE